MNKHPFIPSPAAVALLFGLLCMSALSSCTGCSYNHQKAMGSIDNILGKVDTLMKKTNLKFDNNPFPLLYYCDLYDWDYTKAPIHRREEYYTYCIRKSEDGTDIETFDIAINSRGFGDPPYEGPEYEKYINAENE